MSSIPIISHHLFVAAVQPEPRMRKHPSPDDLNQESGDELDYGRVQPDAFESCRPGDETREILVRET